MPQPTVMEQILSAYGSVEGLMENRPERLEQSGPENIRTINKTNKELPKVRLFHIIEWGEDGLPSDWHEDHPHVDLNGLGARLSRRRPAGDKWAGKPVWLLRIPEGAHKPAEDVACNHPGCPWTGRTEEERQLHYRYSHPQWFRMEEERRGRESKAEELALLRQQVEAQTELLKQNQDLIAALLAERQEGAKRGKS